MAAPRNRLALCIIFGIFCSIYFINGHSHDHGHAHGNPEPAHHKYSQAVNEPEHGHHHHDHGHDDHAHHHESDHHHGHAHSHDHKPSGKSAAPTPQKSKGFMLWLEAISATLLISAAPILILIFIPLDNTDEHQPFLKVLLSFASGGLLGDAFLHLIPHAISPHAPGAHDHDHSHTEQDQHGHAHEHSHDMNVGLWVLAGIVAFLMVEKFVRYVKGGHGHSHGHSHKRDDDVQEVKSSTSGKKGNPSYLKELQGGVKEDEDIKEAKSKTTGKKGNPSYLKELQESAKEGKGDVIKQASSPTTGKKGNPQYKKELLKESSPKDSGEIKVAGYLNLAADFTHNFTDGLAIGASFLAGRNIGIVTTITILLHEVPHEVGDFAILVQSGYSKRKAMMLQLSTAIGAMVGTLCSLGAQHIGDAAVAWIMPFTAGGFIYIATVSVIPELLEDTKPWQSFKEILALLTGVFMMVLIAKCE